MTPWVVKTENPIGYPKTQPLPAAKRLHCCSRFASSSEVVRSRQKGMSALPCCPRVPPLPLLFVPFPASSMASATHR